MPTLEELYLNARIMFRQVEAQPGFPKIGFGAATRDYMLVSGLLRQMDAAAGRPAADDYDRDALRYHGLVRWHHFGLPRFRLTHGIASQFVLTDPDGAPVPPFPFDAFVVEMPHPGGPLVFEKDGERHDVAYLLVSRTRPGPTGMKCAVRGTTAEVFLQDLRSSDWPSGTERVYVEAFARRSPSIDIDCRVEAETVQLGSWLPRINAPEVTDLDRRCLEGAMRIAWNLALHLVHRPSVGVRRGRARAWSDGADGGLVYEVGHDIKVDANLRSAARALCVSAQRPEGWRLLRRFTVRGHWKRQACGAGRSERKMIFVAPYWKGPLSGPMLVRAYEAGSAAP